jgi:hypothetical protein
LIEESIGPIRLRLFTTDVRYFYYELYLVDGASENDSYEDFVDGLDPDTDHYRLRLANHLSPKNPNTIQFVYRGEVLVKRQLDQMKVKKVIEMIKKIKPAIQLIPEEQIFQEPEISHEIQVETRRMTCSYCWSSSEALSSPKQLKDIIGLNELIPSLIDVDYKGLEMPVYL